MAMPPWPSSGSVVRQAKPSSRAPLHLMGTFVASTDHMPLGPAGCGQLAVTGRPAAREVDSGNETVASAVAVAAPAMLFRNSRRARSVMVIGLGRVINVPSIVLLSTCPHK